MASESDLVQWAERLATVERYFPSLDGLRALSVLLVVTVHVEDEFASATAGVLSRLHGELGVTVFFVLSGFLITLLLLRELSAKGRVNFAAFYVRRAFRLFPLYYLVLGAYSVLILGLGFTSRQAEFSRALPYYVLYLQEWPHVLFSGLRAPFSISWSLGIEEKFYLLWPAIAFAALGPSRANHTPRLVIASAGSCILFAAAFTLAAHPAVVRMLVSYGAILLGCASAVVLFEDRTRRAWTALAHPLVPLLGVLSIVGTSGNRVVVALATAASLPALLLHRGAAARVAAHPILVWIGRRSYAVYLIHVLALNFARNAVPALDGGLRYELAVFLLGTALSLLAAEGLFRVIEQPLIQMGRRLSDRISTRSTSPVAPH